MVVKRAAKCFVVPSLLALRLLLVRLRLVRTDLIPDSWFAVPI